MSSMALVSDIKAQGLRIERGFSMVWLGLLALVPKEWGLKSGRHNIAHWCHIHFGCSFLCTGKNPEGDTLNFPISEPQFVYL